MSMPSDPFVYDVFISSSATDLAWVHDELLPRLEQARILTFVDSRDSKLGIARDLNIERAIEQSRKILLVLSPSWLADPWAEFQGLLAQFHDPSGYTPRVVPLLLNPCALPSRLKMLSYADLTVQANAEHEWERLMKALGTRARVWIEYDDQNKRDTRLAGVIKAYLTQAGHKIATGTNIEVGREETLAHQEEIEASDFIVVLLSEKAIRNEVFRQMVEHAYWHGKKHTKPQLLPVRNNYTAALPHPLDTYLDPLRYTQWNPRTRNSMRQVAAQLLDAIVYGTRLPAQPASDVSNESARKIEGSPLPQADPRFIASLPDPGGALNALDVLYIERRADHTLRNELRKPRGTTTTIRGSRQSGKSSLLIRAIDQARNAGSEIVFIDLQPIDDYYLRDTDIFFRFFATAILGELRLEIEQIDHFWPGNIPAANKITNLMKEYVLKHTRSKLILAIDEADRVWRSPVSDGFFSLLRSWTNLRAVDELSWYKLNLCMAISTEPNLLIDNIALSPFNVGTRIDLDDFDAAQVRELHFRYRSPLIAQELTELTDYLGGHPYLSSKALYLVVSGEMPWVDIRKTASTDRGPFSDHLRRSWQMLSNKPLLVAALQGVLEHGRCSDDAFHRLSRAGLIKGDDGDVCTFRCKLYEEYFRKKL